MSYGPCSKGKYSCPYSPIPTAEQAALSMALYPLPCATSRCRMQSKRPVLRSRWLRRCFTEKTEGEPVWGLSHGQKNILDPRCRQPLLGPFHKHFVHLSRRWGGWRARWTAAWLPGRLPCRGGHQTRLTSSSASSP